MDRYRSVVIETRQRELLRDAEEARWAARIGRAARIRRATRIRHRVASGRAVPVTALGRDR